MNDIRRDSELELGIDDPAMRDGARNEDRTEFLNDSIVGECNVTNCRFNRQHRCRTSDITIDFYNGFARCSTYDPKDDSYDKFSLNVAESI
jgi:hypothetical protein